LEKKLQFFWPSGGAVFRWIYKESLVRHDGNESRSDDSQPLGVNDTHSLTGLEFIKDKGATEFWKDVAGK
jgi:hypothetical protein